MRIFPLIVSLVFHAALLQRWYKAQSTTPKEEASFPEKLTFKVHTSPPELKAHGLAGNPYKTPSAQTSSGAKSGSYSQFLQTSSKFLLSQIAKLGPTQSGRDSDGFSHQWGKVGRGSAFGKNVELAVAAPLFLMNLDGYETAFIILNKCRLRGIWVIGKIEGHDYLRAYLYENLVKNTLLADKGAFLQTVPYQQIKVTLTHLRTDFDIAKPTKYEFRGNHFEIKVYSQKRSHTSNDLGYDHFNSVNVTKADLNFVADNMHAQLQKSIARTLKRLERSEAYRNPIGLATNSKCLP